MTDVEDLGRLELRGGGLRLTIDVLPDAEDQADQMDGCEAPGEFLTGDEADRFARWCLRQADSHDDDADRIQDQPDQLTRLTRQRRDVERTKAEALRMVAEIIQYGPGGRSGEAVVV